MLKVVVIHLDMFNKQLTYAFLCFQNKNYNTALIGAELGAKGLVGAGFGAKGLKDFSKKTLVWKYKENLKILKIAP